MAIPTKRQSPEDVVDDKIFELSQKLIGAVAKEIAAIIAKSWNIPTPLGGPFTQIFKLYSDKINEIYFAASSAQPIWTRLDNVSRLIRSHCEMIDKVIWRTPIPELRDHPVVVLLAHLLDPKFGTFFKQQQDDLKKRISTVTTALGELIKTSGHIDVLTARAITESSAYVAAQSRRGQMFRVEFDMAIPLELTALCDSSEYLFRKVQNLIVHRNDWARLVNAPQYSFPTHKVFRAACDNLPRVR